MILFTQDITQLDALDFEWTWESSGFFISEQKFIIQLERRKLANDRH